MLALDKNKSRWKKRSAFSVLGYKDSNWQMIESIWPELKSLNLDLKIKKQIKRTLFTTDM